MSLRKKGFTLVEMLIVIVIIGILAAALIPRLTGIQGRARNTARITDLNQIATALITYNVDNGTYPASGGALTSVLAEKLGSYVRGGIIPTDPQKNNVVVGATVGALSDCATPNIAGEYVYLPIRKVSGGNLGDAFMLMASMEGFGNQLNWGYDTDPQAQASLTGGCISMLDPNAVLSTISSLTCKSGLNESAQFSLSSCLVKKDAGQGRYIYTNG